MPFADREQKNKYQRDLVAQRRAEWFAANGPCVDCGTWENLRVDHVDATTKVTHRVFTWSATRREAELAKCAVRCHPCHVVKTSRCGEIPSRAGEQNGYAKITEEIVRAVRSSSLSARELGEIYRLHWATISKIRKRQRWAHVE
jgi:hypothetical protein